MSDAAAELVRLQALCPAAELWTEGGKPVPFLPGLSFQTPGGRQTRDALLWPWPRDGYLTRLFVSEVITAPEAKNWNPFNIQGRTWFACSWQGVVDSLPWIEILANHLRAFR